MKLLLSILVVIFVFQDNKSPEQIALSYFMVELFPDLKKDVGEIEFNGCTTGQMTRFDERGICFDNDYGLWGEIQRESNSKVKKEKLFYHENSFAERSKNKLQVYSATLVNNKYYVEIELRKGKFEIENYFFEISSDTVMRTCKMKFTIN